MDKLETILKFTPIVLSTITSILTQIDDNNNNLSPSAKNDMKFKTHKFAFVTMGIVGLMQYARGDTNNLMNITLVTAFAEYAKGIDVEDQFSRWFATGMSALATYRN